jgi:16S rRNA (guanine966-N2)-methyltransferase
MRIISGTYRSRPLAAPAGLATRPTSDRLRGTLFNVLAPRICSAVFLDLYAGSGAVGLEALSRGAASVTFVERAAAALEVLRGNLGRLGIQNGFDLSRSSARAFLTSYRGQPFDIIFLDPPYEAREEYESSLGRVGSRPAAIIAEHGIAVAEHRIKQELKSRYGALVRRRILKQGQAALSFFEVNGLGN